MRWRRLRQRGRWCDDDDNVSCFAFGGGETSPTMLPPNGGRRQQRWRKTMYAFPGGGTCGRRGGGLCVCVQSSGYKLRSVRLDIPISSAQYVGIPSILYDPVVLLLCCQRSFQRVFSISDVGLRSSCWWAVSPNLGSLSPQVFITSILGEVQTYACLFPSTRDSSDY